MTMSDLAGALANDPVIEIISVPDPESYDELVAASEAALDELETIEPTISAAEMLARATGLDRWRLGSRAFLRGGRRHDSRLRAAEIP
jgi:hypothetical protein